MGILDFNGVSKTFGEGTHANPVLKNIDLSVQEGEFLVLLGFSGTGKTTLINLMAGLEQPTKGSVTFKGKPITGPGPERGVIFQNYSLMPWLTVNGNVALAVDTVFPKMPAAERGEHKKTERHQRSDRQMKSEHKGQCAWHICRAAVSAESGEKSFERSCEA